jgi:outer membrane protein OmpA-like peptidoglycan-associated protein
MYRRIYMSLRLRAFTPMLVALVFVLALTSSALFAQDQPTPKVDVFAGYSWYNPGLTVNGIPLSSDAKGFGIAPTYNFSSHFGITLDGAGHYGPDGKPGQNQVGTLMVGPRFIWRQEHFYPFVEALAGITILSIDSATPGGTYSQIGPGIRVGGGFDIPLTKRISFRLFQADYVWGHHNLYPQTLTRSNDLSSADLRTGLVFNFGGAPPLPPMAMSCSAANPPAVMAGEPVSVTASVTNIPPKKTLTYDWKSTGGKVSGNGTAAQIDTNGLAPGNYTVTATATDPKPRKDQGPLMCSSNFTVNEPPKHPPTISCSANPTTVQAGGTSAITCTAGNPDSRPLTYNHTSTGGRLTPDGANATLDTAGASAGPITVNSTVTDDRGLSANTSTTVNVEVPPPPPQASNIGTCQFDKDKKRPWRVDNACKAVLDEVALRLQREADSKLVIVGHSDPDTDKKNADKYAAQRAVNSKEYLSGGEAKQQIDPSRIEVRTGPPAGQTTDYWLVPAGATFNQADTQPVDENAVKAPPKPVHHHRAAKKAPAAQ